MSSVVAQVASVPSLKNALKNAPSNSVSNHKLWPLNTHMEPTGRIDAKAWALVYAVRNQAYSKASEILAEE